MSKVRSAQKAFKMLVANLSGGSDPSKGESGNPNKIRTTYETQNIIEVSNRGFEKQPTQGKTPGVGTRQGRIVQGSVSPTFTITVDVANTSTSVEDTLLVIGDDVIRVGVDYVVVNGDVNTTAGNLDTYITTVLGYITNVVGDTITVDLPTGIEYNNIYVGITGPMSGYYTLSTVSKGEPYIGPGIIG